jgi:hypothetical protein
MTERDEAYLLRGKIQMDDAYLGGELSAGRAGCGSENKISIVPAVSLNDVRRQGKLIPHCILKTVDCVGCCLS